MKQGSMFIKVETAEWSIQWRRGSEAGAVLCKLDFVWWLHCKSSSTCTVLLHLQLTLLSPLDELHAIADRYLTTVPAAIIDLAHRPTSLPFTKSSPPIISSLLALQGDTY